jgi:hypothetical protein
LTLTRIEDFRVCTDDTPAALRFHMGVTRHIASMTRRQLGGSTAVGAMTFIAVAVMAACGASSPGSANNHAAGSPSSSGAGAVSVAKGQPMKASNGETVSVTGFMANYPNGNGTLAAGDQCIKVTFSLNNGSSGDWGYPQSELTVVDASGKSHPAGASGGTCPGSAGPADLAAGHRDDTMELTFEVPSSGTLTLKWSPALLQGETYETPLQ